MTTYRLDSMLIHEQYNLVEAQREFVDVDSVIAWELQDGAVYQGDVGFVTSNDTASFSYTSPGINDDNEIGAIVNDFGVPYAIAFDAPDGYIKLSDTDYNDASVFTMNWTDGGSRSATVLAITWEWEELEESTADSATLVIQLTGDDLPPINSYADLGTFLGNLDSKIPSAPPGYQPGDNILLSDVSDYTDKTQDDLIRGESSNDTLFGGIGEDTIAGNKGDDIIIGHLGRDTLRGGEGKDDISGGKRGDLIYGGDGDDMIRGQKGNDTVIGGDGADLVNLGGGKRDVFIDSSEGGPSGNDTVFGGDGRDIIKGRAGDDDFYGENGRDKLLGGAGNDALFGGADDDILSAGSGNDTLTGGTGADVFKFRKVGDDDANVITDFELGLDRIEIEAYLEPDGSPVGAPTVSRIQVQGDDTVINFNNGATILVQDVTDTDALRDDIFAL